MGQGRELEEKRPGVCEAPSLGEVGVEQDRVERLDWVLGQRSKRLRVARGRCVGQEG